MRALPFRRDRAMASCRQRSTSGIGSGSLTYRRDVSETVHRRQPPEPPPPRPPRLFRSVVSRSSGYGGVICPAAWRAAQWGRTSTCLDPQAEQRNPPHTSGNGVSAA